VKDTVCLITGGAGHIGRSLCFKLVEKGARVIVLDKNKEAGKNLVSEFNGRVSFIDEELSDSKSFSRITSQIEEDFGRLDYIVNNAAFYDDMPGWGVPYDQEGYEAWIKVLQVNLVAPFFLVQKLTPLLKKSGKASVVNVSSIYGMVGPDHSLYAGTDMTNPAAYAASKGGLLQLTKWLSTQLAPTVRVNTVTPGGVARGQPPVFVERYLAKTPLKRMATETDVANAIAFLLSDESSYMTGQNLVVDGGWTVW
jgi:NAD(P)-dependent dehydrogenase (short-subunit alcohol dehydrogenase family)